MRFSVNQSDTSLGTIYCLNPRFVVIYKIIVDGGN